MNILIRREFRLFLYAILGLQVFIFAFSGSLLKEFLSLMHPDVRLAIQVKSELEDRSVETTLESEGFWKTGEPVEELLNRVKEIKDKYHLGGWIFGGFIGFVILLKLLSLFRKQKRDYYTINKGNCYSCARCIEYCSREQERLKGIKKKLTLK